MEAGDANLKSVEEARKELPPLPFTYKRTDDPNQAQFKEKRVKRAVFSEDKNVSRSDKEILDIVREQREKQDWFTCEDWREKGIPEEQIEFQINGQQITIYNWNKDKSITEEHIQRAQKVFQELGSRFPQILNNIRWVLIDNKSGESGFGDPEKYPLNGTAIREWRAFRLLPRGMEIVPHRIPKASNFEGTFAHETTHLIQSEFEREWGEKFKWEFCSDDPDEWEVRPTPDGKNTRYFNKTTGEMAPRDNFH